MKRGSAFGKRSEETASFLAPSSPLRRRGGQKELASATVSLASFRSTYNGGVCVVGDLGVGGAVTLRLGGVEAHAGLRRERGGREADDEAAGHVRLRRERNVHLLNAPVVLEGLIPVPERLRAVRHSTIIAVRQRKLVPIPGGGPLVERGLARDGGHGEGDQQGHAHERAPRATTARTRHRSKQRPKETL